MHSMASTKRFEEKMKDNNTANLSTQWLKDNFWNLLISFTGIIIAWSTINNKVSYLEIRAQTNYEKIAQLEELLKNLPNTEMLRLELAPIKADLTEVKADVKKHLQE